MELALWHPGAQTFEVSHRFWKIYRPLPFLNFTTLRVLCIVFFLIHFFVYAVIAMG